MLGRTGSGLLGILVLLLALPATAWSDDDDAPDLPVKLELMHVDYRVADDGSFSETREWAMLVVQERAVSQARQTSVSYSSSLQTLEVIKAYTQKADGTRIDVPDSNYQVRRNEGFDEASPFFSDISTTTIVFPDVTVGDTVVLAYRLDASRPMFDDHFSVYQGFSPTGYYGDARVRFDLPEDLWVQHEAWLMAPARETVADGRRILEWAHANTDPRTSKRQNWSVFKIQERPGVALSTFRDHAQIAAAYGDRATPKAKPTDRIGTLAREIVADAGNQRDQARVLYEWVSTNISYAGNCIGLGAVVPRDLDVVLDNRMGDCKDHATLLQALLEAVGIPSTQALVNASGTFELSSIPVASSVNHVINYLPGLDLYVDATAKGIPFGMLPVMVAGKPVILVDGHHLDAATPAIDSSRNRQRMDTRLEIAADGSVAGEVDVELAGVFAVSARERFRSLDDEARRNLVRDYFQHMGLVATGSLEHDDPEPLLDTFSFKARFEVREMLPMPGATSVSPVFFSEAPVAAFTANASRDVSEERETVCMGGNSLERYRMEFPDDVEVVMVPRDVEFSDDVASYRASHRQEGSTVFIERELDDRTEGPVCGLGYVQAFNAFARRIASSLRSQVVYQ